MGWRRPAVVVDLGRGARQRRLAARRRRDRTSVLPLQCGVERPATGDLDLCRCGARLGGRRGAALSAVTAGGSRPRRPSQNAARGPVGPMCPRVRLHPRHARPCGGCRCVGDGASTRARDGAAAREARGEGPATRGGGVADGQGGRGEEREREGGRII
jgi:hypothetical protein